MWLQFFLENAHFIIYVFTALVFFAVFWLYFDAWLERREAIDLPKIAGFLLLSISFLIQATVLESTILPVAIFNKGLLLIALTALRLAGYILLFTGVFIEPLPVKPKTEGVSFAFIPSLSRLAYPVLAVAIGVLYWRRSAQGYERHLRPVAVSFFILALAEILSLTSLLQGTDNVLLFGLVAPFGVVWILQHVAILAVSLVLGRWVWGYLLKRLFTQLFMIFTLASLTIFLVTTVSFTFLLVTNLQNETLARLQTDVKVLNLALESKKEEALAQATLVAQNSQVAKSLNAKEKLGELLESFLIIKNQSFLYLANEKGEILGRGEDKTRIGDSISDDPVFQAVREDGAVKTVAVKDGALAPQVFVVAGVPLKDEKDSVLAVVATGLILDNAFVDGVKTATGLEATIYARDQIAATTLTSLDAKSRLVGLKKSDQILNVPYFIADAPLQSVDGATLGTLSVGKPQLSVLQTAGRSIELTFIVSTALLVFSLVPSYLIAKSLAEQIV